MIKTKQVLLPSLFLIYSYLLSGCCMMQEPHYTEETVGQYICSGATTMKVKMKLRQDPQLKKQCINVNTYKNTVQLSGFVDSKCLKRKAAMLASHVGGVKQVNNSLIVKTC